MSKKRFRVADIELELKPKEEKKERIDKLFGPKVGIVNIKTDLIDSNPTQPRKYFNRESLEELASSIKKQKVLQPILVRKDANRFQVIAGERRLRAAKLAGMSEVPVIIKELSDGEMLEVSLIENLQREDLTSLEEGEIFQQMIDYFHYTQEELGNRIGKSRQFIQQRLSLLSLSLGVKEKIATRVASLSQARNLVGLNPELQEKVLNFITGSEPTSREVEIFIKKLTAPQKKRGTKTKLKTFMDRLQKIQSAAKNINPKKIEAQQKKQLKQAIESLIAFLLSIKQEL